MQLNKNWLIGSGAAAAVLAGGIYGGTALAQSASPSPSAKPAAAASAQGKGAFDRQGFLQHLAQRLNVSVDQLQNAFKGAAHDEVADALKAGRITQQQADQANQRIDSGQGAGPFGFGHGGPGHGPRGGFAPGQALNAAASKVTAAITNVVKPQLDQAVQNGRMTADQEKAILDRINSGQFPGPGRFGGRPNGANPAASPKPSAS